MQPAADKFSNWAKAQWTGIIQQLPANLEQNNAGYEIAVVVDKKDVICDRYCFSPNANSYYFGLRAYYNGELLNTTGNNPEYKFIIPDVSGHFDCS